MRKEDFLYDLIGIMYLKRNSSLPISGANANNGIDIKSFQRLKESGFCEVTRERGYNLYDCQAQLTSLGYDFANAIEQTLESLYVLYENPPISQSEEYAARLSSLCKMVKDYKEHPYNSQGDGVANLVAAQIAQQLEE